MAGAGAPVPESDPEPAPTSSAARAEALLLRAPLKYACAALASRVGSINAWASSGGKSGGKGIENLQEARLAAGAAA